MVTTRICCADCGQQALDTVTPTMAQYAGWVRNRTGRWLCHVCVGRRRRRG
jgi:hypothetical protein